MALTPDQLFQIPVPQEETPALAGVSHFDDVDGALKAAANGYGPAGNFVWCGPALQARKDQLYKVLYENFQASRFAFCDWRLIAIGCLANLFTLSDPFYYNGPEKFRGVAAEDYLKDEAKRQGHTAKTV